MKTVRGAVAASFTVFGLFSPGGLGAAYGGGGLARFFRLIRLEPASDVPLTRFSRVKVPDSLGLHPERRVSAVFSPYPELSRTRCRFNAVFSR
ncbi:hypothetical protein ACFQZT_15925 [Paenibacillus sp. GCM10027628]|uniref:hypothetical protein n=1 Tax=Paenibacillus sp. GCM10027628 TaxID=3273413 RepID=UPI0036393858